jgi:hypothetical protein
LLLSSEVVDHFNNIPAVVVSLVNVESSTGTVIPGFNFIIANLAAWLPHM